MMTLFGDFYFFGAAAIVIIPAILLGIYEKPIRHYGFVATLLFIWLSMGDKPIAVAYLVAYCLFQLALVKGFIQVVAKKGRNPFLYWTFLLLSLSPLVISKVAGFFGTSIFAFLGISYMTFKAVQIIVETYDGLIKEMKTFDLVYFLAFFPCLSSGPIDRSRRFVGDLQVTPTRKEYMELLGTGLFKFCLGMVYKLVLAAIFYQIMTWYGMKPNLMSTLIYMYAYGFYLFFDFAGYSQMAVGMSYVFGVASPDNFRKPFISTDIKDFWDRWHISLSYWFRDFLFSRLMMRAIKGKWFKNKLTSASLCFMINMTVMGLWHGLDTCYILYGVYHGVLLALTEVYQKKSMFHKKHKKEKWYKVVSWFITFQMVMFGFFIFSGRFTELIGI